MDVAIIGGGAAGLSAACECVSNGKDVTVFEYGERVGQKLLRTGNGRCNLTNVNMDVSHYHGDTSFIENVLSQFGIDECEKMFSKMGILFYTDREGRVYPRSEQASSVLTMLRSYAQKGSYRELCSFKTQRITRTDNGFEIFGNGSTFTAKKLIVATGSQASSNCSGGYDILRSFGHTLTPVFPSLNGICIDSLKGLKGVRVGGKVTIFSDEAEVTSKTGEIQFGDGTLSGICVFDLSRFVGEYFTCGTVGGKPCKDVTISIDLAPEYTFEDVKSIIFERRETLSQLPISEFLTGFINNRLARHLIGMATQKPFANEVKTLGSGELMTLVRTIKNLVLVPRGVMPMSSAQAAAGGIVCNEFMPQTMESRLVSDLYAVGEVLNCDGDCGGYNLHWAWATGKIAGNCASK